MNKSLKLFTAVLFFMGTLFLTQLSSPARTSEFTVFYAALQGNAIMPQMVETTAGGGAGATLRGNKLKVTGNFSNLTGNLRDYRTDPPAPPNPNITSAVHIHRGSLTENGPFQYALTVSLNAGGRSGTFSGEYDLTPEQMQALKAGQLYVDLHTTTNRGGELRGVLKPI